MKQKILLALGCILLASGAWATNYTLTLYADGCESPNTFICQEGQQFSVSAISMEHRHFVKWSDGNTDNPRTVVMTADITLTAEFEEDMLEGMNTIIVNESAIKVLIDNQILIQRGDCLYDLRGQEIR